MKDFPYTGGALVATDGTTLAVSEDAAKALQAAARRQPVHQVRPGDKADTPAPDLRPLQVWYADPAKHPNSYIAVTFETPGEVVVRDGEDPTGKALHYTREQWASFTDPDWSDEDDQDAPAEVTNPADLHKVKDKPDNKPVNPERG